jgi:hypothetical protein
MSDRVVGSGTPLVAAPFVAGQTLLVSAAHGAAQSTLNTVGSNVKLAPPKMSCPLLVSPGCDE